jgi:hypothetical protein
MSTVSGVVGNHCGGSQWHFSCYYSEVEGQFGNEGAWRAGRSGGSCNFQMRLSFSAPESVTVFHPFGSASPKTTHEAVPKDRESTLASSSISDGQGSKYMRL